MELPTGLSMDSPVGPRLQSFTTLLEEMAAHLQDYVSDNGRLTTNIVEDFHGLAVVYWDKRTVSTTI